MAPKWGGLALSTIKADDMQRRIQARRLDALKLALDAANRLRPYLNRYCDAGWPGLSERDRGEAGDARADLLYALDTLGVR